MGAIASIAVATAPASSAEEDCAPVAVIAFRGSGQDNIDPAVVAHDGAPYQYAGTDLVTNGWEGTMLQRLFTAFAPIEFDDGFRADSVPVIGVGAPDEDNDGYPAIAAAWEVLGRLNGSAEDGVAAAQRKIEEFQAAQPAECTDTQFVAVGFSQGAMVSRLLAQQNPVDIAGVINVGDPYQLANSVGTTGTGADGQGIMRWNYPWYRAQWDQFYDLDIHKSAICHRNDPICDFRWGTFWRLANPVEHGNYMTGDHAAEADEKGAELAGLAHQIHLASQDVETPVTTSADVVFAIDTTGSMAPYINQAVATAEAVAEATLTSGSASRVGLVEYRDHGDAFVAREVVELTTDFEALTTGLDGLVAAGGGDFPEAVYSGIITAAQLEFRPDVARSIMVLGDAPPHDPEPVTGYTAADVIEILGGSPFGGGDTDADSAMSGARTASALTATGDAADDDATGTAMTTADAGGLPIVLYTLGAERTMREDLEPIVEATGGLTFELVAAEEVTEALRAALEDTLAAPSAHIGVSPIATVGIETSISAVGSTAGDPDLTYAFDLDGDGTYELDSDRAIVRVTFAEAGQHEVGVRITDSRGRSDVARTTVDVAPLEALEPVFAPAAPELVVEVAPATVDAGERVVVSVTGGAPDGIDLTDAALLLTSGDVPWSGAPVLEIDPLPADALSDGVLIPADLPGGTYQLTIVTAAGEHGSAALDVVGVQVEEPTTPGPEPTTPGEEPTAPGVEPTTPGEGPTTPGVEPTTGDETPGPGGSGLPSTGAEVGMFSAGALALVLMGLALRRRTGTSVSS